MCFLFLLFYFHSEARLPYIYIIKRIRIMLVCRPPGPSRRQSFSSHEWHASPKARWSCPPFAQRCVSVCDCVCVTVCACVRAHWLMPVFCTRVRAYVGRVCGPLQSGAVCLFTLGCLSDGDGGLCVQERVIHSSTHPCMHAHIPYFLHAQERIIHSSTHPSIHACIPSCSGAHHPWRRAGGWHCDQGAEPDLAPAYRCVTGVQRAPLGPLLGRWGRVSCVRHLHQLGPLHKHVCGVTLGASTPSIVPLAPSHMH